VPIQMTEKEFARLRQDRPGQKPPLRVKVGSAWHRRIRTLVEGPREPTPIERLAAHGYTRRVSETGVWFEKDGDRTPCCADLKSATAAALAATKEQPR
jgi:hypothetical protein